MKALPPHNTNAGCPDNIHIQFNFKSLNKVAAVLFKDTELSLEDLAELVGRYPIVHDPSEVHL